MLNFIFIYNKGSVFDSVYTYSYHSVVSIHRKPVLLARFGRYYKLATAHCIFRKSVKLLFGANIRARWGVCKAPTGASPRNPQTSAAQPFRICNPLQNRDFCRTGPVQMLLICLICKSLRFDFDRTRPASAAHQNQGPVVPSRHPPVGPVSCPTPTLFSAECKSLTVFSPPNNPADICREHLQISC